MRPIKSLISIDEAREIIERHTTAVDRTEAVPLTEASGRVTARSVSSRIDIPPFDRAAMDGYALRAEDSFRASKQTPVRLGILGKIHAGEVPDKKIAAGTCVQIATGAVMPEGADAVVMVEYTDLDGEAMTFTRPVYPGENVSRAGADMHEGDLILGAGVVLAPAHIGSLAAAGFDTVEVYDRPGVTVVSTGDEVVKPPQSLGGAQVYDVNSFTTGSLLLENGARVTLRGPCRDDLESIEEILHEEGADMLIFTGGSSVGERDILVDALEKHGEVLFHGVAVKPGKPTLFARTGSQIIFGMPGYPASCLSNGYMFLIPVVRKMAHLPPVERRTRKLPIGQRVVSTIGRHQFFTVTVENGIAVPAFKESGAITSMSRADGYIEIPANVDLLDKDEIVEVTLF
jgi:molybdenum cofactor synthesis domain-containing protein